MFEKYVSSTILERMAFQSSLIGISKIASINDNSPA